MDDTDDSGDAGEATGEAGAVFDPTDVNVQLAIAVTTTPQPLRPPCLERVCVLNWTKTMLSRVLPARSVQL